MIVGIDPKVDYAFKRIYGRERNRGILRHILNAILQSQHHAFIADLDLLNPYNDKETSDDKLSIVDVKARDQLGRQFNVEMQLLGYRVFPDRALYYWSRLHGQQLHSGEDFSELQPTITVCFVDAILFPEVPDYHLCFHLRADRHAEVVFSPHLELHLFELPKFRLAVVDLTTELEKWLYFLRHAEELDSDVWPTTLDVPEIRQAFEELFMLTQSDRDRARYEERFKAQLDARSLQKALEDTGLHKGLEQGLQQGLEQGLQQGLEQGLQQGLQQGLEQGDLIGRIHLCQKMLRQPQTPHDELLALGAAELQRLGELLEQQLNKALRPNGND